MSDKVYILIGYSPRRSNNNIEKLFVCLLLCSNICRRLPNIFTLAATNVFMLKQRKANVSYEALIWGSSILGIELMLVIFFVFSATSRYFVLEFVVCFLVL